MLFSDTLRDVVRCHFYWLNALKSTLTDLNKQHTNVTENNSCDPIRTTWLKILDWRADMLETCRAAGEGCSSVSAAAYSSTLTTELRLRSDQILTRPAASVHVTHDGPADLSADKGQNVKSRESQFAWNPPEFGFNFIKSFYSFLKLFSCFYCS